MGTKGILLSRETDVESHYDEARKILMAAEQKFEGNMELTSIRSKLSSPSIELIQIIKELNTREFGFTISPKGKKIVISKKTVKCG